MVLKVAVVDLKCFPPYILFLYFIYHVYCSHSIIILHTFSHNYFHDAYVSHTIIMQHLFHTLLSYDICFHILLSWNIYFTHYYYVIEYFFHATLFITRWSSDSWLRSCTSYLHRISFHQHPFTWSLVQRQNSKWSNSIPYSLLFLFFCKWWYFILLIYFLSFVIPLS